MEKFEIKLENLRFYSHHGMYEHETRDGNEFEVNLSVIYTLPKENNILEDSIANTISYVSLFEIVDKEMKKPRKLMETVAMSISHRIKNIYLQAERIECKITKLTPPIPHFQGSASIVYTIED